MARYNQPYSEIENMSLRTILFLIRLAEAEDMKFEDGAADSNGRAIDSFTMISYIDETVMIV
jgi:hypothetical protein